VAEAAGFWLKNLDRFNGRNWWPKAIAVQASVDASAVGYGGFTKVGSEPLVSFTGTFSTEERGQSSTAHEVRGYAAALETAAQRFPETIRNASILLEGDNQGAISALDHFRSPVSEINQVLRGVFQLCCDKQLDVVAKWIPRDNLTEADALSRLSDPSGWGLSASELWKVFEHFKCRPMVDIFASDVHHVADRFITRFFTPGCFAFDATRQDWSVILQASDVVWVFPPHRQISTALSMIEKFRMKTLVCLPIKAGSNEIIQLHPMKGAAISHPCLVPRHVDSCVPSARVPPGTSNPALLELGVVHVTWN
jgi:hypothetical protein